MTKTVILVGAGATIAEALPSQPAKKNIPPLDTNFFELCRLNGFPGRRIITKYMEEQYGIKPFNGGYRMEEVFNFIYSDAFSESPSTDCLEAYWRLIQMYSQAIAHTTSNLHGASQYGVGALLRKILTVDPNREIDIITFNQDLVIEKTIEHIKSLKKYNHIKFDIKHAYNLDFSMILAKTGSTTAFSEDGASSIKILKLHGSLNWGYRVRSGTDPKNSIRKPNGKPKCIDDQEITLRAKDISSASGKPFDLIPLIVPPIYEKASAYRGQLDVLWTEANKFIKNTDELIVFGYSFPDTDFSSKTLFSSSISSKQEYRCSSCHRHTVQHGRKGYRRTRC